MNLAGQRRPSLSAADLFSEQPHDLISLLFYDSSSHLLLLTSSSVVNQRATCESCSPHCPAEKADWPAVEMKQADWLENEKQPNNCLLETCKMDGLDFRGENLSNPV